MSGLTDWFPVKDKENVTAPEAGGAKAHGNLPDTIGPMPAKPARNGSKPAKPPAHSPGAGYVPWTLAVVAALLLGFNLVNLHSPADLVPYSAFKEKLRAGAFTKVELSQDLIQGMQALPSATGKPATPPQTVRAVMPKQDAGLLALLDSLKVEYSARAEGGRGISALGKSRAQVIGEGEVKVSFRDVAGVDDLFKQARDRAPCIIFIDELDAIGKSRSSLVGGHDEREQTLNQLLVEMDGFDPRVGVIILAATNRPETLDSALLRRGRSDRHVVVDKPDLVGREAILRKHAWGVRLEDAVDLAAIARRTPGFVGADLADLINEGALVASFTAGADPVEKISIIPRGLGALGFTWQLPTEERFLLTENEMLARIDVLLGGRAANGDGPWHERTVPQHGSAQSQILHPGAACLGNIPPNENYPNPRNATWMSGLRRS